MPDTPSMTLDRLPHGEKVALTLRSGALVTGTVLGWDQNSDWPFSLEVAFGRVVYVRRDAVDAVEVSG